MLNTQGCYSMAAWDRAGMPLESHAQRPEPRAMTVSPRLRRIEGRRRRGGGGLEVGGPSAGGI
jgi:hypothetical protein